MCEDANDGERWAEWASGDGGGGGDGDTGGGGGVAGGSGGGGGGLLVGIKWLRVLVSGGCFNSAIAIRAGSFFSSCAVAQDQTPCLSSRMPQGSCFLPEGIPWKHGCSVLSLFRLALCRPSLLPKAGWLVQDNHL